MLRSKRRVKYVSIPYCDIMAGVPLNLQEKFGLPDGCRIGASSPCPRDMMLHVQVWHDIFPEIEDWEEIPKFGGNIPGVLKIKE